MNEKMIGKPYRFDVHHHIVPSEYRRTLSKIGLSEALGRNFPEWTQELALEMMDRNQIQTAITSISSPGVYFGDNDLAKNLSRECNEISARLEASYPERFGAFMTLPLPDIGGALRELEYGYETLRLDGVVLLSNYSGIYVGDHCFNELYEELNRRSAIAYIHPTDPVSGNPLGKEIPTFLMEVTFDTTRVIFHLIYNGILERYPNIRWIMSHAGGAAPYLAWRISLGQFVLPDGGKNAPKGALYYMKRLYYDTGLSGSAHALRSLQELVVPSHILFGTDFPFAPEMVASETIKGIKAYDGFSDDEREIVEHKAARSLFPRFYVKPR